MGNLIMIGTLPSIWELNEDIEKTTFNLINDKISYFDKKIDDLIRYSSFCFRIQNLRQEVSINSSELANLREKFDNFISELNNKSVKLKEECDFDDFDAIQNREKEIERNVYWALYGKDIRRENQFKGISK